jgi:hypothetical protein
MKDAAFAVTLFLGALGLLALGTAIGFSMNSTATQPIRIDLHIIPPPFPGPMDQGPPVNPMPPPSPVPLRT